MTLKVVDPAYLVTLESHVKAKPTVSGLPKGPDNAKTTVVLAAGTKCIPSKYFYHHCGTTTQLGF